MRKLLLDRQTEETVVGIVISRFATLPRCRRYIQMHRKGAHAYHFFGKSDFRAVPQFTCPFWHRERWLFLKEKATLRKRRQGTAIVEPL
jgi:hypothetical protein